MKRVLQRGVALLALVAFTPVALADPPGEHQVGDGIRVDLAPLDLPEYAEVVEVDYGLIWLVLDSGDRARAATKVGTGVYLTAPAWRAASRAFNERGRRIQEFQAEVAGLRAQIAAVPPARECPEQYGCPTLEQLLPAADTLISSGSTAEASPQQAPPSIDLGFRGALVVLGVGLVAGAVGGAYLTARTLR